MLPSTCGSPSIITGANSPGIEHDALMICPRRRVLCTTGLAETRFVVTTLNGILRSSIRSTPVRFSIISPSLASLARPVGANAGEATLNQLMSFLNSRICECAKPAQYSAPTTAPALAPATIDGLIPRSLNARSTPKCVSARLPPPPRTSPIFFPVGRFIVVIIARSRRSPC